MSLTLHEHPFASYCWKALIALYERDIPFERHFVGGLDDRARLAELWPLASIPVLVDSDGLTLPESTVIVEYLDRRGTAPPMIPVEPDAAYALLDERWRVWSTRPARSASSSRCPGPNGSNRGDIRPREDEAASRGRAQAQCIDSGA